MKHKIILVFCLISSMRCAVGALGQGTPDPIQSISTIESTDHAVMKMRANSFTADTTTLKFTNMNDDGIGTEFLIQSTNEDGLKFSSFSDLTSNSTDGILLLEPDGAVIVGDLKSIENRVVTANPNGRLEAITTPKFMAYLASTIDIPSFTDTLLTNFSETTDDGGNFDHMAGVFIAPADGFYHFDIKIGCARISTDLDNNPFYARLYVNGSLTRFSQGGNRVSVNSSYGDDLLFSTNLYLSTGDTVRLHVLSQFAIRIRGGLSTTVSFWTGYMVR